MEESIAGACPLFLIPYGKYYQREKIFISFFKNTPRFYDHPNIIHAQATADMEYKTKFINTSDAMIHARLEGESFGLSCGEFSIRNKPVITWDGSHERNPYLRVG